jgi:hypothetical protein
MEIKVCGRANSKGLGTLPKFSQKADLCSNYEAAVQRKHKIVIGMTSKSNTGHSMRCVECNNVLKHIGMNVTEALEIPLSIKAFVDEDHFDNLFTLRST